MKTVALFDIADQSFTFYTDKEWCTQVRDWKQELKEEGQLEEGDVEAMDTDEVVECIGGDEYFWDNIA